MSANRPSRQTRREREERSRRTERLVIGGAIAVLALAVVLVLIGLYFAEFRPPRAHVLTIDDRDYNAAAMVRRTRYEIVRGATTATSVDGAIAETVDLMRDAEVLLLRAPDEVGEVTDDELDTELRDILGFADSDDEAGFADAYADLLRAFELGRDEYEELVSVEILRERLREQFREEIGESVEQYRASRLRLVTEAQAMEAQTRLADGEEFAALVDELGAEPALADVDGDLGWQPLEGLPQAAREEILALEPGAVSGIIEDGLFFDLYRLVDHEADRELEEGQIVPVVEARLASWLAARRDSVLVELDMSNGERDWIRDELTGG